MAVHKITESVSLEVIQCEACGYGSFAMSTALSEQRRQDGKTFYCPMGHSMSWRESEIVRLRRERDIAVQQVARAEQERADAEARAIRAEVATKRTEKRANAGVCLCCHRSFANVARHMATKHKNVTPLKAERVRA